MDHVLRYHSPIHRFARLARGRACTFLGIAAAFFLAALPEPSHAEIVTLKSGFTIEGRVGKIGGLSAIPKANAANGGEKIDLVVVIDDDMRRSFVSTYMVQGVAAGAASGQERILINQKVADAGLRIGSIGAMLRVTEFDDFGRRTVTFQSVQGPIDVIQGITEISPQYCRVQGLIGGKAYVWDLRIATSSIPREKLSRILMRQIDPKNADERLRIVRLYIQGERYQDASKELSALLQDFPNLADLAKQEGALKQAGAERLIKELKFRRAAGQHGFAYNMLSNFPANGIAGETLVKVKELLDEYNLSKTTGEKALKLLETHLEEVKQPLTKERFEGVRQEIAAELNMNTLDRLADYLRLADDEKLTPEQKLSLATSGWILGPGSATENVTTATSLLDVRRLARKYMLTTRKGERDIVLTEFSALEAATPAYLAKVIYNMTPPSPLPEPDAKVPGLYRLSITSLEGEEIPYLVQVPPEYDPHRKYPTIVTLHGGATSPEQQLDWWAGVYDADNNMRRGQATRQGYIVIAPAWGRPHQTDYEYSAREHAAITSSLRDACRRFSIDTDRVFLSGHSMGGDAAWDLALAHPDLWAGVLPLVATAEKFVPLYWETAKYVSFYFVAGEMDGDRLQRNAPLNFDRYLSRVGYDSMVVEYRGRGHEHFQDEITRMFEWMAVHQRNFANKDFKCFSMRPWDNYFWWVELDQFPERAVVSPVNWPPAGKPGVTTDAKAAPNNRINITTGAGSVTVWLLPDMVQFGQRLNVSVNGRVQNAMVAPKSDVILEDVRTRGDRQHPFWAKLEFPGARAK